MAVGAITQHSWAAGLPPEEVRLPANAFFIVRLITYLQWAKQIQRDAPPEADLASSALSYLASPYPPLHIVRYIRYALSHALLHPHTLLHLHFEDPHETAASFLLDNFSVFTPDLDLLQLALSFLGSFSLQDSDHPLSFRLAQKIVLLCPSGVRPSHPQIQHLAQSLLSSSDNKFDPQVVHQLRSLTPLVEAADPFVTAFEESVAQVNTRTDNTDEVSLYVIGPGCDVLLVFTYLIHERPTVDQSRRQLEQLFRVRPRPSTCLAEILLAPFTSVSFHEEPQSREEWIFRAWAFSVFPSIYKLLEKSPEDTLQGLGLFVRVRSRLFNEYMQNFVNNQKYEDTAEFGGIASAFVRHGLLQPENVQSLYPDVVITEPKVETNEDLESYFKDHCSVEDKLEELLDKFKRSPSQQLGISQLICQHVDEVQGSGDLSVLSSFLRVLGKDAVYLDVTLLHIEPVLLLAPIRSFVETFEMSSDYGDEQAMEMFGTVFTFLHLAVYRHGLSSYPSEYLGTSKGFFNAWLGSLSFSIPLQSMDANLKTSLDHWISALFGDGISDDLIRSTNPRILLILAPTLVKQCILACVNGSLDRNSLKSGLSYFGQDVLSFTTPAVLKWLIPDLLRQEDVNTAYATIGLDVLQTTLMNESMPRKGLELAGFEVSQILSDTRFSDLPFFDAAKIRSHLRLQPPLRHGSSMLNTADSLSYFENTLTTIADTKWTGDVHNLVSRAECIYGSLTVLRSALQMLLPPSQTSMRHYMFLLALLCHRDENGSPVLLLRLAESSHQLFNTGATSTDTLIELTAKALANLDNGETAQIQRALEKAGEWARVARASGGDHENIT